MWVRFFYRQYFIIIYKEKALEIWDLKNLSLLREMSAQFPLISALVRPSLHYRLVGLILWRSVVVAFTCR